MGEQTIVPEVLLDKAIELGLSFSDSAFPIGIFPSEIRNIIAEVHECQGFPIDYIASAMLVAIAVGIGNTHLVQLKRGWQESAMLYVALVGRPGTNKSHPLSFAMKPFLDFDYQENKLYERAYTEYDNVVRMSRKERIEAGHSEQPTEPIRRRFIVSDITPEGLSFIHAQNKRGLCLWSDELSAWFKNFNRYNSGSEEQFWLSVFSAKATISDRKGNRSSIFIKRPYISVVGTIQKKILGELSKGERSSNGFIDRILFVMPNLQQKARWSRSELPESTEGRWSSIIQQLIEMPCSKDEEGELLPEIIPFAEDAKARLYMWQEEHGKFKSELTDVAIVLGKRIREIKDSIAKDQERQAKSIASLSEKIQETQSPPEVKKYYLFDVKRWIEWLIWGISIVLIACTIGWAVYLRNANQTLESYALRYRILRMEQGYNNPTITHLDNLFSSESSSDSIRELRHQVSNYELAIQRQAELALQQQRITEEQAIIFQKLK